MRYVLKALNEQLKLREERAKENYKSLEYLKDEVMKLRQENKNLRNDLAELSKELLKNKKWQDQEKQKD